MAKRKKDCLDKLIKDTWAKCDVAYEVLVKMLSELVKTKEKYEALCAKLKNYIEDPDDLVQVEDLCVRAGSDETLDNLMDIAGYDTLDEFEAFVRHWAAYKKAHEDQMPVAWMNTDDCGGISSIVTTPDFWDCECSHDYVHPNTEKKCSVCGALRYDHPDSRANEVVAYFESKLGIKYPTDEGGGSDGGDKVR